MFSRLTILTLMFLSLTACNMPRPYVYGTPAYKERVAGIERDIQKSIAAGAPTLVFHTSAEVVELEVDLPSEVTKNFYNGPVSWVSFTKDLSHSGSWVYLSAHWNFQGECERTHEYVLEYYEHGKLVARKSSRGPGMMNCSLML